MSRRNAGAARAAQPVQYLGLKWALFAVLCAVPVGGAALQYFRGGNAIALLAYTVVSAVTFGLYWHDKRQARRGGPRTPEKVLHGAELLGGWPGAVLAQQVFRHKTRKVGYQCVFWAIVVGHEVGWVFLFLRHAL